MVIRRRLRRARWLARYWALDKYPRQAAALGACLLAAWVVAGVLLVLRTPAPGAPAQALAWFWWLAIAIVSAFVIAALMPKPPPADPQQEARAPETKDGKQLVRVYGTVWIDDAAVTGWVNNDPEPIRRRSGKK
jgi:hypothetical protein